MSKKHNGVNYSKTPAHKFRRESALKRLENQLILKTKIKRIGDKLIPLSKGDVERITKEIVILKNRINK